MSTLTADDILELCKQAKVAKAQRQSAKKAKNEAKAAWYATVREASASPAAPEKKHRKARDPNRARSDKEKANDEKLKQRIALAKELRAADPSMKWTDAVKAAAAQMKAA